MCAFKIFLMLFAVLISVDSAFAILCSSERPPCPDGQFCKNISCENVDLGRCIDIDECANDPCQNGGTCNNLEGNYTCDCAANWEGRNCEVFAIVATDCLDLLNAGITTSGVYPVQLWNTSTMIEVYCDMVTDGGGWTVFQKRINGSTDFYKTFAEYENGFGDLSFEFWLGLRYVQEMAAQSPTTTLRLQVTDVSDVLYYRHFSNFTLTTSLYVLNIGPFSSGSPIVYSYGTLYYHNGFPFSTFDADNDISTFKNCAERYVAGWWFKNCQAVNLNSIYSTPGQVNYGSSSVLGIVYTAFQQSIAFKTSMMMFRRD